MERVDYLLKTLDRGLDVLEHFESSDRPLSMTDVARDLNRPIPIIQRILYTLENRGYIHRNDVDKTYTHSERALGKKSVLNALRILIEISSFFPENCTSADLSKRTGLDVKDIEYLADLLAEKKIIENINESEGSSAFSPSNYFFEIVKSFFAAENVNIRLNKIMNKLRDETGETVIISKIVGSQQVVSAILKSKNIICYSTDIGTSFPIYAGAGGKAYLSTLTSDQLNNYLTSTKMTPLTKHTPDIKTLKRELKEIQKLNYAISAEERVKGAAGVAICLKNHKNEGRTILSVAMPVDRGNTDNLHKIGKILKKYRKEIFPTVEE